MKTTLIAWLLTVVMASAYSGLRISPLVVHVHDSEGNVISKATVKLEGNGLEGVMKQAGDSSSKFAKYARLASGERKTDTVGVAVVYFVSGASPIRVDGFVIVTAPGYADIKVPVSRTFESNPQGATKLMLSLTIKMKRAEQGVGGKRGGG